MGSDVPHEQVDSPNVLAKAEIEDMNSPDANDRPDLEPMTMSLMGRLFGLPLLIIGGIVGGAVVVVLLFGGQAAPREHSLDELVTTLESSSGEKSLGVLLPREKELWQTALELSMWLKDKQSGLAPEEVEALAMRLGRMVQTDLANLTNVPTVGDDRANQLSVRSKRTEFLIHALGRTGHPVAVRTLVDVLNAGREPFVQPAMQELAELHELPATRAAVAPMLALLVRPTSVETKLVACTALSVVARSGDQSVIDGLTRVRLADDGDVAWVASLALARLGSVAGKTTLLDLLDRTFLESGDRYHVVDESGKTVRYRMPPQRVEEILKAAIDAVTYLADADLWGMVDRLKSDPSPAVRGVAMAASEAQSCATIDGYFAGN